MSKHLYEHLEKPAFSWGLARISQPKLPLSDVYLESLHGGAGVGVYLVDTGIDYTHSDLQNRAQLGFDAFGGDGSDELGNGTFLASIISTIAPKAQLYSVTILDNQGNGSIEGIIEAIEWITLNAKRPAVVNVAIGIPPNDMLDEVIKKSIDSGIIFVLEGGGSSEDVGDFSPARVREGIVVGASDSSDCMAEFSNFGEGLDIFAPGVDIISSALGAERTSMSGVQVAAAHVSGVTALHLSVNPHLTPLQVKEKLISDSVVGELKNVSEGTPNRLLQIGY